MHILSFTLAGIFFVLLQITVTVHIILHKEDVSSAIGWMGLVWLAPILGSIIYIVLGINRIRRKARRLHHPRNQFILTEKNIRDIEKEIPASLLQLMRLGYKVHPQHLSLGNRLIPLQNGDEAYPRMCEAIAAAKQEVLIASYIFNNDIAGQRFVEALKTAVQNGARVRMLVDGVGLNYSHPNIARAVSKIKGIEFAVFLPSKHPVTLPFVNLRNHRKMMIIDGETAFFGGMNIAQGNLLKEQPKDPIQDVTFEVHGPVIAQIKQLFEEDWTFSAKTTTQANKKINPPANGQTPARIIPDGPDGDFGKIEQLCLGALSCAQKSIYIVTPYFLPGNEILTALETAALRGVNVNIILPQKSNIFGMDWAMQANFQRLLKQGIHIYRTKPPFDHSKLFIVDETWLLAGSANWDVRSFKLNFESSIECFDPVLAKQVLKIIEQKKKSAVPVTYDKLPLGKRILFNTMRLLTPYY